MTVLFVGGAFQGKAALAKRLYPDLPLVQNLHALVRDELAAGRDPMALLDGLRGHVVTCDEVGCGVVPIDPVERQWREETGRLCCLLAQRAQRVERIFCGIAMTLKATEEDGQNEDHTGAAR